MNIPCAEKITCPCADDSPFANLSSAAPDEPVFIERGYVGLTPPLGTDWPQLSCFTFCASTVSAPAAQLCAETLALFCAGAGWRVPGPVPPHPSPVPVPPNGGALYGTVYNTQQSCTVTCPDGTEFTYGVPAGIFGALATAGNAAQQIANAAAFSYACAQAPLHRICLSDLPGAVCAGDFAQLIITATGGFLAGFNEHNTWSITAGAIPDGMTFYGDVPARGSAELVGTPATPGVFSFTVRCVAPNGDFQVKDYVLGVAGLVAQPPTATVGAFYVQSLVSAGFAHAPVWTVESGSLPDGLALALNGEITGTPTTEQTTSARVRLFDPVTRFSCTVDVGMTVAAATGTIHFNDTVWNDPPDQLTEVRGTASGTWIGNHGNVSVTYDDSPLPHFLASAIADNSGSFLYTGPDANCTVVFSGTASGCSAVSVSILQDGFPLISLEVTPGHDQSGTYNFTVAAGVASTITVIFNASSGRDIDCTFVTGAAAASMVITPN